MNEVIEVRRYFLVPLKYRRIILIGVACAALAAGLITASIPVSYHCDVELLLGQVSGELLEPRALVASRLLDNGIARRVAEQISWNRRPSSPSPVVIGARRVSRHSDPLPPNVLLFSVSAPTSQLTTAFIDKVTENIISSHNGIYARRMAIMDSYIETVNKNVEALINEDPRVYGALRLGEQAIVANTKQEVLDELSQTAMKTKLAMVQYNTNPTEVLYRSEIFESKPSIIKNTALAASTAFLFFYLLSFFLEYLVSRPRRQSQLAGGQPSAMGNA